MTSKRLRDGNSVSTGYDALNRMISRSGATVLARTYSYDLQSEMTGATLTSSGRSLSMTYDALGRLIGITGPQGAIAYQYDAAGRRTRLTWPDSFYVNFAYLVTGETAAITDSSSNSVASYGFDDLGRRTSLTRGDGSVATYSYDGTSQLTVLSDDLSGTTYDQSITMSYNPAGQIASRVATNDSYAWSGAVNLSRSYSSNGLNQYSATGAITPSYDSNGNVTSAGSTSYGYDGDNLMTSAGSASLYFDPLDRFYQISTSIARVFNYDGADLITEYDGSNNVLRRFIHGPQDDEPVAWYEGSGTSDRRFLHADERGSVVAVTNSSGGMVGINSYDEYGIPGSGNIGRFQYTGQLWLGEIGMYHYKARAYSPTLGRFMQSDPIGYADGMNWYNYAAGDPINKSDPSGLVVPPAEPTIPDVVVTGIRLKPDDSGKNSPFNRSGASGISAFAPFAPNPQDDERNRGAIARAGQTNPGAKTPQKLPKCTLAQARRYHNDMVNHTAVQYMNAGYRVAFNVSLRKVGTGGVSVRAVADFIATRPGSNQYEIHEIKTGDAQLSRNQKAVYDTGFLQVVGNSGLSIGLEDKDVVAFIFMGERRFEGCTP